MKWASSDGGAIDVRWRSLPDGRAEFAVKDTGPGIAPEHISRLTERFYRVDGSRSRDTGCTGLGLSIVKHVMQRHGGTLDKFIGDGLMAVFGAPVASSTACEDGLACAQAMIRALERFNAEQLSMDTPAINIGVGLHYGPAVIGYDAANGVLKLTREGAAQYVDWASVQIGQTVEAVSIEEMERRTGLKIVDPKA